MNDETSCVEIGQSFVISSKGPALREKGYLLGQYDYDDEIKTFKLKTTGSFSFKKYLIHKTNLQWLIGSTPNTTSGFLWYPSISSTIPTKGWKYYDTTAEEWNTDKSIKIQPGKIKPCSKISIEIFGLAADKWPGVSGLYKVTDSWANGRPIFESKSGNVLYVQNYKSTHSSNGKWCVGSELGTLWIHSLEGTLSPTETTHWEYWTGVNSTYFPADIEILCRN